MFAAIGYGLLSLLDLSTPVGQWAGFEILYGVGCGAGSTAVRALSVFSGLRLGFWLRAWLSHTAR